MKDVVKGAIRGIDKMCIAQIEAGDEEGAIKSIEALGDLAKALMADLPNDPNYKALEDMTPEEINAKVNHIMGWLKPFITRISK
jgi:hypothetical protein